MRINDIRTQRIELLKKYYPVDTEKKVVTFKLYYEHASELLDYTVGEIGKEMFKGEFLDKVSDLLDKLPIGYKADIILEIGDYDVYDENIIMEKFDDFLQVNSFDVRYASKKNGFLAAILLIVGCVILTLNAILTTYTVLGNGTILSNVLNEALDITSWVFIWQAVTVLFLSPSSESRNMMNVFHRLNSFGVASNGEVKVKKDNEELSNYCRIDSSFSSIQKQVLAITSSLLFFEGVVVMVESLVSLFSNLQDVNIPIYILKIVLAISILVCGVLALTRFTYEFVGNRKFIISFTIATVLMVTYFIWNFVISGDWSSFINLVVTFILLNVTCFLCFFWGTLGFKKPKKKE